MADHVITALNAIYWAVMAAWFVVLVTDNDSLTGWGSAGFLGQLSWWRSAGICSDTNGKSCSCIA